LKNPEFEILGAVVKAFYKSLAHVMQRWMLHGLAYGDIPGMNIHAGNADTQ
jgi:hypothetical protein